ncbi:pyridoxamine 5'-phosphate oxidase family protein [Paenibacillus andongensis]|uniref:pyridoxamine 5'-phosphate oxidase family protein n=1 Tax=Paenibacillus andongensis TaxID=2975482 RepID=UPI0021BB5CAF|nr:pyridoxamine 5'-phosphate oxidase family protein [Paenibacillus andongensis]
MTYHPGEIQVQERAGLRHIAERSRGIRSDIPDVAKIFLEQQPFLIIGAPKDDGTVWASALFGAPGFVKVVDPRSIALDGYTEVTDPITCGLRLGYPVATIAMDFAGRRRMRANGIITAVDRGRLEIATEQVYANCPKYIQARMWSPKEEGTILAQSNISFISLPNEAMAIVRNADTCFIASHHPEYGADVSHRGGMPGFIKTENDKTLVFPDYTGNAMFNTLGNLNGYPQAGLLFMDFDSGSLLQLTGTAEVEWDVSKSRFSLPGAERLIRFRLERGHLTRNAMPLNWSSAQFSPANPRTQEE